MQERRITVLMSYSVALTAYQECQSGALTAKASLSRSSIPVDANE